MMSQYFSDQSSISAVFAQEYEERDTLPIVA